jgi:hypothetical protein
VYGFQDGYVEIKAIDLLFPSSPPASAIVKVADISHVSIEGLGLVEEGHSVTIELKVFDEMDNIFPTSQYHAMKATIEVDQNNIASIEKTDTPGTYT